MTQTTSLPGTVFMALYQFAVSLANKGKKKRKKNPKRFGGLFLDVITNVFIV